MFYVNRFRNLFKKDLFVSACHRFAGCSTDNTVNLPPTEAICLNNISMFCWIKNKKVNRSVKSEMRM